MATLEAKLAALSAVAHATIEVQWNGHVSSMLQLASVITKASRYLFITKGYHSESEHAENTAIEADVLLRMAQDVRYKTRLGNVTKSVTSTNSKLPTKEYA